MSLGWVQGCPQRALLFAKPFPSLKRPYRKAVRSLARGAAEREVGHDFAYARGDAEAVSAHPSREDQAGQGRVIDHRQGIGQYVNHAGPGCGDGRYTEGWKGGFEMGLQASEFSGVGAWVQNAAPLERALVGRAPAARRAPGVRVTFGSRRTEMRAR